MVEIEYNTQGLPKNNFAIRTTCYKESQGVGKIFRKYYPHVYNLSYPGYDSGHDGYYYYIDRDNEVNHNYSIDRQAMKEYSLAEFKALIGNIATSISAIPATNNLFPIF